jgi:aspartyl-tRNA(Asn)/glutamyl-tRNA(Gln) amidotransferase subunit A
LPSSFALEELDAAVERKFADAIERLRERGVRVIDVACKELSRASQLGTSGRILLAEAASSLDAKLGARVSSVGPLASRLLAYGRTLSEADVQDARRERRACIRAIEGALAAVDALVMPTVKCTPPRLCAFDDAAAFRPLHVRILANTCIANIVDGCAISLPIGGSGPPVGLMLQGAHGCDERLLDVALAVESVLNPTRSIQRTDSSLQ